MPITITFAQANDPQVDPSLLTYDLFTSNNPDIDTVLSVRGLTPVNTIVGSGSFLVDIPAEGEEVWFNVRVRDLAGNAAMYQMTVYKNEIIAIIINIDIVDGSTLLDTGGTVQLVAVLQAEGVVDTTVLWSSSREDFATVDANGLVTATGEGQTLITARSQEDITVFDTITITVNEYEFSQNSQVRTFTTITE